MFTYNHFWKLVSISIISAVFIPPSLQYNLDKQTNKHTHTQQLSFNNIDIKKNNNKYSKHLPTVTFGLNSFENLNKKLKARDTDDNPVISIHIFLPTKIRHENVTTMLVMNTEKC